MKKKPHYFAPGVIEPATAAPAFTLRKGQTQLNLDILNHVAAHQECKFEELADLFCVGKDGYARGGFKGRLSHLVNSGQLTAQKGDPRNTESWTFSLGPLAGKLGNALRKAQALDGLDETHEPSDAYVGTVAPPRSPEVMTGSNYCPKPMQALRPGSGDFTRLPSLRQGQRLPFTGGYVAVAAGK